jgi:MoxR-like ATPase
VTPDPERLERWHAANARHLAAALAWLRRRLAEVAGPELVRAAADRAAAEAADPPPALTRLARQFGLSRFEQDVLLLCAASELDPHIPALCAQAQADLARTYPTFALALSAFDEPAWDILSPERPLRYWRLVEIHQPGAQPLTASPLRADERVVHYLKGMNEVDDRLMPLLTPAVPPEGIGDLTTSQQDGVDRVVGRLHQAAGHGRLPPVHLGGPDVAGKRALAWHAATRLGLRLYRLPAEVLPAAAADLDTVVRLWQRECLLLPVALYLDAYAAERAGPPEALASVLNRFLARANGVIFLDAPDGGPDPDLGAVTVEVVNPTAREQRDAWAAELGADAAGAPRLLAGQFDLGLGTIRHIARAARDGPAGRSADLHQRLWDACLAQTRPRLEALAGRLEPRATWDDLVLPAADLETLRQIAAQVRQRVTVYEDWGFGRKMSRGRGVAALFSGESGTGKTMAAEVLANDLRLGLYRIDLSAVVSKYVGETEKNLRRLFDAAEGGGAILFFDEADALFGKRGEVKDSHDRYANIEVNYLLQRMESYRGLAVLATNLKSALDPAFLRRLRFLVNFPYPGVAERRAIWERVFPPETPREGLDLDRLARLTLPGGGIHNVALHAAFLAAEAGSPVTMRLVLEAARAEYRKLERPVSEAEFRMDASPGAVP